MRIAFLLAALACLAATPVTAVPVTPGVSLELAMERKARLSDIRYTLTFVIPANKDENITARETVRFALTSAKSDLQLDFRERAEKIQAVTVNGTRAQPDHRAEHLVLPAALLREGENVVEIEFVAGDSSLNRNPDYLYTLFVPDRARTAFPVFDQPDLKARYDLTLDIPATWQALANARLKSSETASGRTTLRFATSDLIPSYLFSFVAGRFEVVERTVRGRPMRLLHRETDPEKIARSLDTIFEQHAAALEWMAAYSGIPYPFQKFDFVAIPAFQYGGMEHVGAIQYDAEDLFLDKDPSEPQQLARANLIAHETAHMWFGDLVTMKWFDDVWTKEVFANFMAAKMVNPGFPGIDHDLNFLLRSFPAAYAVDRTAGANPIRQNLGNLNEAGTLYGGIIYNKAPIMMQQLEMIVGEEGFRAGMREYLATFANGNATWPELVAILDKRTPADLARWSEVWVSTAGRPDFVLTRDNRLEQRDPENRGRIWAQRFNVLGTQAREIEFEGQPVAMGANRLLFNSDGRGYGLFPVDPPLIAARWEGLTHLQKGAQLVNLYEQMLEGDRKVPPRRHFSFLVERLASEDNELLLGTMLRQASTTFWKYLPEGERSTDVKPLEDVLWTRLNDVTRPASTRKLYLSTLRDVSLSPAMLDRIEAIWADKLEFPGISLSEREKTDIAAALAIKRPGGAEAVLKAQMERLSNPDDRRRLTYLLPSLSADPAVRERFFAALAEEANRASESWVLTALSYLHHPLRTAHSQRFVRPSLDMLEEIQATGDIFFPEGWAAGNLSNHSSPRVAADIRDFLARRPTYNHQLRLKILQAADPVFRAERLKN
ncbi:M1 family metallopeptidase [Phenylobacterium sp.]|jgi:aminopeptidase N|uniref:M1 family metallopeptidase n=1 Tax=Phenylobacterium sp. TaxID=1871053 RepID=UPI0037C8CEB7